MTRQVVVEAFEGERALQVVDAPEPFAAPDQVRVRVLAAGLNPVDMRIADGGATAERFEVSIPYVNGNDFAGVIDEVGRDVRGWSVGDRVYGGARCRAQTDHLIIDDLDSLIRTPDELPDRKAAVLDISARTAWAGIDALQLREGETVMITAAAGGCGLFATQFALRRGAHVLGVAGSDSHAIIRQLGAQPVDYRSKLTQELRRHAPDGVSALFDAHGGRYIELGLELGVPVGRINSVGDRDGAQAVGALSVGRAATSPRLLEPLGQMVADGELLVRLDGVYPVASARDAYRRLEEGHVHGKLVLDFSTCSAAGDAR